MIVLPSRWMPRQPRAPWRPPDPPSSPGRGSGRAPAPPPLARPPPPPGGVSFSLLPLHLAVLAAEELAHLAPGLVLVSATVPHLDEGRIARLRPSLRAEYRALISPT